MYRTASTTRRPERLVRVHPLADARILVPVALVVLFVAFLVLNVGSLTVAVRVEKNPGARQLPVERNDLLIAELDADYRRWAAAPVANVKVEWGRLLSKSVGSSSFYTWPTWVRVERQDTETMDGRKRAYFHMVYGDDE